MPELPRHGAVQEDVRAEPDDDILHSVTRILKVIDKSDPLIAWACNVQAERTVADIRRIYSRLKNEGTESAVEYVNGLRWRTGGLLSDADLGRVAHHLFDDYALTGTRPDVHPELHPKHAKDKVVLLAEDVHALERMLTHFDRFLEEFQPDYQATEAVVYNPRYGYAGQTDAFLAIQGNLYIVDYKTSRKTWTGGAEPKLRTPYPEAGLQLAAYRYAEAAAIWRARRYKSYSSRYYLLSPTEKAMAVPVPTVEGGLVVHVTPERLGVYPVRCGPDMFEAFLHVLEVARWSHSVARDVVGNEMPPPFPRPETTGDPFAGLPTN